MLLREMQREDMPREKFAESPKQATLADLVAILLRTGRKGHSVMEIAQEVVRKLTKKDGLTGFDNLDWRDLTSINGIGPDKAVTVCAAIELGRRLASLYQKNELIYFGTPERVAKHFMEQLRHEEQEHFFVCFLNVKNKLLGYKEIGIGNMNAAPVDIKEAMRWALRFKAYGLILVHNHPSGDPEPSRADIHMTKVFVKGANLLDMTVLDHIVIGDGIYVSLQERNQI